MLAIVLGTCDGGGCGLALVCDMRFAAEDARLGITPSELESAYSIAAEWDLVDRVAPAGELDELASAYAKTLLANAHSSEGFAASGKSIARASTDARGDYGKRFGQTQQTKIGFRCRHELDADRQRIDQQRHRERRSPGEVRERRAVRLALGCDAAMGKGTLRRRWKDQQVHLDEHAPHRDPQMLQLLVSRHEAAGAGASRKAQGRFQLL
jgi:enoyl-CoA hydratase/carnithine racemase